MEQKGNLFYFLNTYKPFLIKTLKLIYVPLICSLAIGYYFYKKEQKIAITYNSGIIYMLEEELSGNDKSASGNPMLAAIMGGGGSSNKKLMVDLAKSNKLLETTMLKTVVVDSNLVVLANYYIDNCGMRKAWKASGDKKMMAFNFPKDYEIGQNKEVDYLIRTISQNIQTNFVSRTLESGLILMEYTGTHEMFTKTLLDNHFVTISEFYATRKSKRSSELIQSARKKKDQALAAVRSREAGLAANQDNGFGVVMNRAKLGEVANARELTISQSIYQESVVAYNSALLDLERNKPLISIVDDPRLPLKATGPDPFGKGMKMFFILFFIEIALLFGIFFGLDVLKKQRDDYKKATA